MEWNDPNSVLGDLKMKLNLIDPLTSLAFSGGDRQLYVKGGEDKGICEFYGTRFQMFALLSGREIKDKTLYEILITLILISLHQMTIETLQG